MVRSKTGKDLNDPNYRAPREQEDEKKDTTVNVNVQQPPQDTNPQAEKTTIIRREKKDTDIKDETPTPSTSS